MKVSYIDRERPRLLTISPSKVIEGLKHAGMQRSRARAIVVDNMITDRSSGQYNDKEREVTLYPRIHLAFYMGLYEGISEALYGTIPRSAPTTEQSSDQALLKNVYEPILKDRKKPTFPFEEFMATVEKEVSPDLDIRQVEARELIKRVFTQIVGDKLKEASAEVLAHELDHSTRKRWREILAYMISPRLGTIARRNEEKHAYKAGEKYGKFFENAIEVDLEALYKTLFPEG